MKIMGRNDFGYQIGKFQIFVDCGKADVKFGRQFRIGPYVGKMVVDTDKIIIMRCHQ